MVEFLHLLSARVIQSMMTRLQIVQSGYQRVHQLTMNRLVHILGSPVIVIYLWLVENFVCKTRLGNHCQDERYVQCIR